MKKAINRKVYDTSNATKVAFWQNGYRVDDSHYEDATLYVSDKRSWFLHGTGGAMTQYARRQSGVTSEGEDIIALSPKEAADWLESHNFTEALERYFPDELEEA